MLRWVVLPVILIFTFNLYAADRVVLLAPAAADILAKLGCEEKIAGKTKSVEEFPDALNVGSHIRPNLELIMSLSPDMIIIPSNRFFTEEMVKEANVPVVQYNPSTLEGILAGIAELGRVMERNSEAEKLIKELRGKLDGVQMPEKVPSVVFEVMQLPYTVAGEGNIVADIIAKAGGKFITDSSKKMVRFSMEKVVELNPDIYIYQTGPMNKSPEPPEERAVFKSMKAQYLNVDEREYSRANSSSFDKVLELNSYFNDFAKRNR